MCNVMMGTRNSVLAMNYCPQELGQIFQILELIGRIQFHSYYAHYIFWFVNMFVCIYVCVCLGIIAKPLDQKAETWQVVSE